ncbi:MAG TPA: carbonic anhydrase family protein [Gemmatimonadaceae bacterium]|nr:carbonic anhydrase family protein [Gemmatimonadaceae bacterium]
MRTYCWLVLLMPAMARAQWKTPWSYDGPRGSEHWADLDPSYATCRTGKAQSPIDISTAQKADLPAIRFDYRSGPLKYLINNGYTVRVNYHDSTNALVVGDKRYYLTQFHFHRPSEEYIHGKPFPMEAHIMHRASDGEIAGVVVMIEPGAASPLVQQIWDHMPTVKGDEHEIPGVEINPLGLIPRDRSYYRYMGSIGAPPCNEGVVWIVLETPVTLSATQIAAFAALYPHDVRPVQPLNGRIVQKSR